MNTQTATKTEAPAAPQSKGEVAVFQRPRLPWHPAIEATYKEIGVTKSTWKALIDAVYPAAKSVDSVIMALSYCKARKLDPFKRPIHIVPVWDQQRRGYVDTVWPGISEIRTTAMRTGLFAGMDSAVFGDDIERTFTGLVKDKQETTKLRYPAWAQITVYRMIQGQRVAIQGPRVYWEETYATIGRTELPNAMWEKRPRGQIEKCSEAAALRRAFPEELGNEYSAEEMEGSRFYAGAVLEASKPQPPQTAAATLDALVTDHDPETGEILTEQTEAAGDGVLADESATEAEGPLARGMRLLATQATLREITDLCATILEELTDEAEQDQWRAAVNAAHADMEKRNAAKRGK